MPHCSAHVNEKNQVHFRKILEKSPYEESLWTGEKMGRMILYSEEVDSCPDPRMDTEYFILTN